MKTRMVEERIGERLGDIDWNYDFASHGWTSASGGHNPKLIPQEVERLREMETAFKAGHRVFVKRSHGETYEPVNDVGMYDGWPYWRPVPSFNSSTWLGGSWHCFTWIADIRVEKNPETTP